MRYRIGIDVGGTKIKGALIKNAKQIISRVKRKTNLPKTLEEIEKEIENIIDFLIKENKIKKDEIEFVGIGCPGIVDSKRKVIEYSCNFDWHNVQFTDYLEKKLKKPVFIDNDANAAAVGEYIFRDLKNIENMILITLGTGIGSGIILNGKLYKGFNFSAGEAGHMIVKKGGRRCNCGNRGCFERYASKTGVVRTALKIMEKNKDSLLWERLKEKGKLTAKNIFEIARKKDKTALEVVEVFVKDLSVGVANLVNIFQPEILVIGGGISSGGDLFIGRLKELVKEADYAKNLDRRCEIFVSQIGNDAGLIGAANIDKF